MIGLIKEASSNWSGALDSCLWIQGQIFIQRDFDLHKAQNERMKDVSNSLDWDKEIEFLKEVRFESFLIKFCSDLAIEALLNNNKSLCYHFCLKAHEIQVQNTGSSNWLEVLDLISEFKKEKLTSNRTNTEFLRSSFPISKINNISKDAIISIVECLRETTKSKRISWIPFYNKSFIIQTTSCFYETSKTIKRMNKVIHHMQMIETEESDHSFVDEETFSLISQLEESGIKTGSLFSFFESCSIIQLDKTSFEGDCINRG